MVVATAGAGHEGIMGEIFGAGAGPVKKRNPLYALLVPLVPFVGGLAGLYNIYLMLNELSRVNNAAPPWWHVFIPFYNFYVLWISVPAAVRQAKQQLGAPNPEPQGIVLYIFLFFYAFANDLNELADRAGGGAPAGALPAAGMSGPPPGGAPGGFGGPPPGGAPGGFGGPPPGGAPGGFGGPPPGGGFGGPPGGMQ